MIKFEDIKTNVGQGKIPNIISNYRCKTFHVVEFESSKSDYKPVIWLTVILMCLQ